MTNTLGSNSRFSTPTELFSFGERRYIMQGQIGRPLSRLTHPLVRRTLVKATRRFSCEVISSYLFPHPKQQTKTKKGIQLEESRQSEKLKLTEVTNFDSFFADGNHRCWAINVATVKGVHLHAHFEFHVFPGDQFSVIGVLACFILRMVFPSLEIDNHHECSSIIFWHSC